MLPMVESFFPFLHTHLRGDPIPCLISVVVSPCRARAGFRISHYILVSDPGGGDGGR